MKKILVLLMILLAVPCLGKGKERRAQVLLKTSMGDIRIELYNETPLHRDNFLNKVREGKYDGLLFHRVIKDFMIQGGDQTSKNAKKGEMLGNGLPGEEEIPAEIDYPKIFHKRGAIAMAREGDDVNPEHKSSSWQFYIVWGQVFDDAGLAKVQNRINKANPGKSLPIDPSCAAVYKTLGGTPHLDRGYTVFGEVVQGLDVVDKIQQVETDDNDRPIEDVKIIKARVLKSVKPYKPGK